MLYMGYRSLGYITDRVIEYLVEDTELGTCMQNHVQAHAILDGDRACQTDLP